MGEPKVTFVIMIVGKNFPVLSQIELLAWPIAIYLFSETHGELRGLTWGGSRKDYLKQ